jgi:hypothetical protein
MIAFNCPKCKSLVRRQDSDAGIKIPCPTCGQRLQIPLPPEPESKTVMGELLPARIDDFDEVAHPQALSTPVTTGAIIQTVCSNCQATIRAPIHRAGTTAACPRCRQSVDIPGPTPAPIQKPAPPVVVNVINATAPPMPVPDQRAVVPFEFEEAAHRSGVGPWIAVFVIVALAGASITGLLWYGGIGPFQPKPKDLIVGRWKVSDPQYPSETATLVFYKDGVLEWYPPKGDMLRSSYRFLDDSNMELTSPTGSFRAQVKSVSNDELTLISADGTQRLSFRRFK